MKETPVVLYEEVPVPEPNLFLLHKQNIDFIKRVHNYPVGIGERDNISGMALKMTLGFVFVFIVITLLLVGVELGCVLLLGLLTMGVILPRSSKKELYDQDLVGWILPGEIVVSKKIKVRSGHFTSERFVIRYLFTAPNGELCEAKAMGFVGDTNYKMTPTVGTPVRVWYPDKGTPCLL